MAGTTKSDKEKFVDIEPMSPLLGDEGEVKEGKRIKSKQTINQTSIIINKNKSWI